MATSQVAFGLTDVFDGNISSHANENANLPAENASDPLPGKVFEGGSFDVSADNRYIDIDEGSGEVSVALTIGTYTGSALIAHIVVQLNASALGETYTGSWTTGTFALGATDTFSILWDTGTNSAGNIGDEIGFDDSADDTGSDTYTADEDRHSTHTFIVYDLGAAKTADAVLLYLETDDDDHADFSDLVVYSHSSDLGDTRYPWDDTVVSSLKWTASTRPTSGYNRIQIAHPSTGSSTQRYWMVSWRHFDEVEYHRIGLSKAYAMSSPSGNVQVAALPEHHPFDRSEHRSIDNQYPVAYLGVWRTLLDCKRWPIDDYEDELLPLVEHGKKTPVLWALRWEQNKDSTHATNEDIRLGFVLWACVASFGALRFDGRKSEFASCAIRLEQER